MLKNNTISEVRFSFYRTIKNAHACRINIFILWGKSKEAYISHRYCSFYGTGWRNGTFDMIFFIYGGC